MILPKRPAIRVIGPSIAYIPLTKGQYVLVDEEDAALLEALNWCALPSRGSAYAVRRVTSGVGKQATEYMHRRLMSCSVDKEVDHRNGNRLDNRRSNLRSATPSQNRANIQKPICSRSGRRGVHPAARPNAWLARIGHQRKRYHLGTFNSPEEAAQAYRSAAQKLHGEFCGLR